MTARDSAYGASKPFSKTRTTPPCLVNLAALRGGLLFCQLGEPNQIYLNFRPFSAQPPFPNPTMYLILSKLHIYIRATL